MTNRDKLRSMSDLELAYEIMKAVGNLKKCRFCNRYGEICDKRVNCKKHIAEWLKQEVNDERNGSAEYCPDDD